jgi:hypothetical protein
MRRGVREIEWISSLDGMTPDPNESVKKPETEDHGCQPTMDLIGRNATEPGFAELGKDSI